LALALFYSFDTTAIPGLFSATQRDTEMSTSHKHKSTNIVEGNPTPSRRKAVDLMTSRDYDAALIALSHLGSDSSVLNLRGVCLLRTGKTQATVNLFRSFMLKSGCTWTRPELPDLYKVNFATALLLNGHPTGCLDLLSEVHDQQLASVIKLRETLRSWVASLSWWQRFNWKFGRMEPNAVPPAMNLPGEYEAEGRSQPVSLNRSVVSPGQGVSNATAV
jgi:hypothetical protein